MAGTAEGAAKARATRGTRVPKTESLGHSLEVKVSKKYVVINKPLNMGDHELAVGEIVEGAESWPRVEAWERARRIKAIYVPEEQ